MQTFAASMHSSISLCASLRTRGRIFSIRPFGSHTMYVSVVSRSIAPRASRACASASYSAYRFCRCGIRSPTRCAAREPGTDSASHTSVYVRRAWECITAG